MMPSRRVGALLWVVGLFCGSSAVQAGYVLTDLGALGTGPLATQANAINDAGQVAGTALVGGQAHAFLYSGGVVTDLGTLGGSTSRATGIDPSGRVVGTAALAGDGTSQAFLWKSGPMTDLGTLGGLSSDALAINDRGQVVGSASVGAGLPNHSFVSQVSGGLLEDLGPIGPNGSTATAVNHAGLVVGTYFTASGSTAYVSNGMITTSLDGAAATGINDAGTIVGYGQHALSFTSGGLVTDLGTLGGTTSQAWGINDAGVIVGSSTVGSPLATSPTHAFLAINGVLSDLNQWLPAGSTTTLVSARAINNRGQIVGTMNVADGSAHAFLLTPTIVPEPSGLILAGLGIVGGAFLVRKQRP